MYTVRRKGFAMSESAVEPLTAGKREVIVTLTSYGQRVEDMLPYALYSLMNQTVKPNRILLWLDNEHWNDNNLPAVIKQFVKHGLEVRYCEDIRSYKKLIPTIETFPNAIYITADDDIYYKKTMVGELVEAWEINPRSLHAFRANSPTFTDTGALRSYSQWKIEVPAGTPAPVFPTSGGGVAYTRELLYADVCRQDLFLELSPLADDVWLYFMTILNHTPIDVLGSTYGTSLDILYRRNPRNASLQKQNMGMGMNDVQIQNVMNYYGLSTEDLCR